MRLLPKGMFQPGGAQMVYHSMGRGGSKLRGLDHVEDRLNFVVDRGLDAKHSAERVPRAHSWRSAVIGSNLEALCAGTYAALSATNSSSAVANASVSGSWGATP